MLLPRQNFGHCFEGGAASHQAGVDHFEGLFAENFLACQFGFDRDFGLSNYRITKGGSSAFEITGSHIGDAPVLPDLLSQIPANQEIGSVTADGAYESRKCHDAIADRGGHAVIPPRKNAKPWKAVAAGAVARNEALRASKYLGRALWRRWSGYHRRSRVETKMHCVKLLGQMLMARDFDRQVAELQVRIAVLNGHTALGIPVTEAVE